MKRIQKNFIIIFIIMFLFSFSVSVFADTPEMNPDYDYLYTYQATQPNEIKSLIELAESDDRVISGDFVYFCGHGGGAKSDFCLLIRKTKIIHDYISGYYGNFSINGGWHNFNMWYSDTDLSSSDLIWLSGRTDLWTNNGHRYFILSGKVDNETKTWSIPFATNWDYNVYLDLKDGSKAYLNYEKPYIANTTEQLQNLNASLAIVLYDVPSSVASVSLHKTSDNTELFNIKLSDFTDYVQRIDLENPFSNLGYVIPWDKVGANYSIEKNQNYELRLTYTIFNHEYNTSKFYNSLVDFSTTGGSDTPVTPTTPDYKENFNQLGTKIEDSNKETQNTIKEQTTAINNQTEEIKKQHETSKNIFQKIGEMLSYINPFSENFFGRKLVELILNGLKSLFVPEEGFFSEYFNELRDWFSDRLGFLWAPFDFIIEVLNRIANINFSEPIIDIPEIKEPFTNKTLISATTFNFNSLLENETLKNVHDIYLFGVDFIICLGLYNLAKNKMEGVFKN